MAEISNVVSRGTVEFETQWGLVLLRVTGHGHITLRAAFGSSKLAIPQKGMNQQGISLGASSGGKVSETLWGYKARKGLEFSCEEHKLLQAARCIFTEVYRQVHLDPQPEIPSNEENLEFAPIVEIDEWETPFVSQQGDKELLDEDLFGFSKH